MYLCIVLWVEGSAAARIGSRTRKESKQSKPPDGFIAGFLFGIGSLYILEHEIFIEYHGTCGRKDRWFPTEIIIIRKFRAYTIGGEAEIDASDPRAS